MRVLVAGATGAVGTVLVPALREAGLQATPHVRPQTAQRHPFGKDPEALVCDLADATALDRGMTRATRWSASSAPCATASAPATPTKRRTTPQSSSSSNRRSAFRPASRATSSSSPASALVPAPATWAGSGAPRRPSGGAACPGPSCVPRSSTPAARARCPATARRAGRRRWSVRRCACWVPSPACAASPTICARCRSMCSAARSSASCATARPPAWSSPAGRSGSSAADALKVRQRHRLLLQLALHEPLHHLAHEEHVFLLLAVPLLELPPRLPVAELAGDAHQQVPSGGVRELRGEQRMEVVLQPRVALDHALDPLRLGQHQHRLLRGHVVVAVEIADLALEPLLVLPLLVPVALHPVDHPPDLAVLGEPHAQEHPVVEPDARAFERKPLVQEIDHPPDVLLGQLPHRLPMMLTVPSHFWLAYVRSGRGVSDYEKGARPWCGSRRSSWPPRSPRPRRRRSRSRRPRSTPTWRPRRRAGRRRRPTRRPRRRTVPRPPRRRAPALRRPSRIRR